MNYNFSRIDRLIDRGHLPGYCKTLVRALSQGSSKKMSASTFHSGTDTRHLAQLGLIKLDPETSEIQFTGKAKGLLSRD
jgi:hypothetical protein